MESVLAIPPTVSPFSRWWEQQKRSLAAPCLPFRTFTKNAAPAGPTTLDVDKMDPSHMLHTCHYYFLYAYLSMYLYVVVCVYQCEGHQDHGWKMPCGSVLGWLGQNMHSLWQCMQETICQYQMHQLLWWVHTLHSCYSLWKSKITFIYLWALTIDKTSVNYTLKNALAVSNCLDLS